MCAFAIVAVNIHLLRGGCFCLYLRVVSLGHLGNEKDVELFLYLGQILSFLLLCLRLLEEGE